MTSDYYRGFVSLDYLKKLDNTYSTGVKLRSKYLCCVSHEQSLIQINSSLAVAAFRKASEELKLDLAAHLGAVEEESKVSNILNKSAARSEHSGISNNLAVPK